MSMDYIRKTYGVKVKRGDRVAFNLGSNLRNGTVTGASHYLRVRFDGYKHSVNVHPTDPALIYGTATVTA